MESCCGCFHKQSSTRKKKVDKKIPNNKGQISKAEEQGRETPNMPRDLVY